MNILDFGLRQTDLHRARGLARWLGIRECFLKLEIQHPTRTVKDRITELVLSHFLAEGIRKYAHCSAGNAGTSLVWGIQQLGEAFEFDSFIPEAQLAYHNFERTPGVRVTLLEGAQYEEAKQYCSWYARTVSDQPELLSFKSDLRRQANKVPYLEAFEQIGIQGAEVDFVCQAISDGGGIMGAWLAASDALGEGWITSAPAFVVAQPRAANPVVRGFRTGLPRYSSRSTLSKLGASRAFAIRRRDASGYYADLYPLLRPGGYALDATERQIAAAKEALLDLEGIDAGYTACTSLAALRQENQANRTFRGKNILVMITGADRSTAVTPPIDQVISRSEWRKTLSVR